MRNLIVLPALTILVGCVMSMSASQFYEEYPTATKSRYMTGVDAGRSVLTGDCIVLDSHEYRAPQGSTVQGDVRNSAEGVDAIVINDGGNSYRISDFGWYPVSSGTQLVVGFDTLLCSGDSAAPVDAAIHVDSTEI